jgi:hypothetical protein
VQTIEDGALTQVGLEIGESQQAQRGAVLLGAAEREIEAVPEFTAGGLGRVLAEPLGTAYNSAPDPDFA